MPAAPTSSINPGLVIASVVLVLTAVFSWRQWAEHQARDDDLLPADGRYYRRRDIRRAVSTTILGLIGIGMVVGSLLNHRTQTLPFLWVWLGVVLMALILIVLALFDMVANFGFAARHRRLLIEERLQLIEDEFKRSHAGTNGHRPERN